VRGNAYLPPISDLVIVSVSPAQGQDEDDIITSRVRSIVHVIRSKYWSKARNILSTCCRTTVSNVHYAMI